jgi:hypothetical protein
MANSDKSKFVNTQDPKKLYEMIKTLCYTFGQISLGIILTDFESSTEAEGWKEFENIF